MKHIGPEDPFNKKNTHHFLKAKLLEIAKWVKDPWNGLQMIPPTAPDWFESISGVLDPFRGL